MHWAEWAEADGITKSGGVEVMPFLLCYDNLDGLGYFLQEEKKNLKSSYFSEEEKKKRNKKSNRFFRQDTISHNRQISID